MKVSGLDESIGIFEDATSFEGLGGRIRVRLEDFRVEEVVDDGFIRGLAEAVDGLHRYAVYIMDKAGIDTLHAVRMVEQAVKRRVYYLGLKDARARAEQYISFFSTGMMVTRDFRVDDRVQLKLIGFSSRPLTRKILLGNRFRVKVSQVERERVEDCLSRVKSCLDDGGVPNFYGYQRFGVKRPVSHLIGRELLKRRFNEALTLLLTYTTRYDENKVFRELCRDSSNYIYALSSLPSGLDVEGLVLQALIRRPRDHLGALRSIPLKLRRLFVNAYQSYIYNKVLSYSLKEGLNLLHAERGDLVGEVDAERGGIVKVDVADSSITLDIKPNRLTVPVVPLVGYGHRLKERRFDILVKKVLCEEEVDLKDFYVKELAEVSVEGGFRIAPLLCHRLSWSFNQDVYVEMHLPKGSYATIVLREVMKPEDPVAAGF